MEIKVNESSFLAEVKALVNLKACRTRLKHEGWILSLHELEDIMYARLDAAKDTSIISVPRKDRYRAVRQAGLSVECAIIAEQMLNEIN